MLTIAIVLGTVVVTAVVAYLFLKHNPAKKAVIDAAEQKIANKL